MSRIIDDKIIDKKAINKLIAKKIRMFVDAFQEKNKTTREYVASLVGVSPERLSQMLGAVPSNDEEMYKKILRICGQPAKVFDDIRKSAILEYVGESGAQDIDFALSEALGHNPKAIEEMTNSMQYIKHKYGIK